MMNFEVEMRALNTDENSPVVAYCSLTIEECFVIRGVKLVRRRDGSMFVDFPNRRTRSGEHAPHCHPITKETRSAIEEKVMEAYENFMAVN